MILLFQHIYIFINRKHPRLMGTMTASWNWICSKTF